MACFSLGQKLQIRKKGPDPDLQPLIIQQLIIKWTPPPGYGRVPYLALQGADELTILGEDGEVEVVVIVRDGDLPRTVDAHPDGIVGDA